MDRAKCLWCGNMGTRSGSNFCSKKCEVEWEQWKNKGNNYSSSGNSSRTDTSPDLIEGAFTVIGAGLSLLTGSNKPAKPAKPSAAERKQQRDAEWAAMVENSRRRAEERERDPEYQAEKQMEEAKYRQMDSWSLEEWYNFVDATFESIAEEIKKDCARARYYKDDVKLLSTLEKYREIYKEKVRRYYEILHSSKKTSFNKKNNATWEMRYIDNTIRLKTSFLTRRSLNASFAPGPIPLVVVSVLVPIVCIILGIILRKPIIPILSFIIGWFMFAIWESKWQTGKIKFYGYRTLSLGGLYLATIGIIAGVVLHSFLIGLFSVIAGIALMCIAFYRYDKYPDNIFK